MYSNRLSVAVLVGALAVVMPAFGGSLGELCSGPPASEVVADLCEAQASLESLQIHLQRVADKVVASGDVQKRKNEFVRFGRSYGDEAGEQEEAHDMGKRKNEFVRFGKRKNEFVRFGKKSDGAVDQPQTAEKRKNEFVRFG